MQDGFNLAEAIILAQKEAEERREPCVDYARAFKEYEAEMVPYGHDAVKGSRGAVHFMHRPIEAPNCRSILPRWMLMANWHPRRFLQVLGC
jgi:hypothetical protein